MQDTPKLQRPVVTRSERIYWGDCDPAGIIFYPRYFDIFDRCTTGVFERALGMNKREFFKAYDFAGFPLVDIAREFLLPTRFGDDVIIESTVPASVRSSFDVSHRLLKDGKLAVECSETRVWVARDPPTRPGSRRRRSRRTWSRGSRLYAQLHSISAVILRSTLMKRARSRGPMMRSRLRSCARARSVNCRSLPAPAGST